MYVKSLCIKFLKMTSILQNKLVLRKWLSLSNYSKMPLNLTFYHVSLLSYIYLYREFNHWYIYRTIINSDH